MEEHHGLLPQGGEGLRDQLVVCGQELLDGHWLAPEVVLEQDGSMAAMEDTTVLTMKILGCHMVLVWEIHHGVVWDEVMWGQRRWIVRATDVGGLLDKGLDNVVVSILLGIAFLQAFRAGSQLQEVLGLLRGVRAKELRIPLIQELLD